jgi:translation initiation factor IF-2
MVRIVLVVTLLIAPLALAGCAGMPNGLGNDLAALSALGGLMGNGGGYGYGGGSYAQPYGGAAMPYPMPMDPGYGGGYGAPQPYYLPQPPPYAYNDPNNGAYPYPPQPGWQCPEHPGWHDRGDRDWYEHGDRDWHEHGFSDRGTLPPDAGPGSWSAHHGPGMAPPGSFTPGRGGMMPGNGPWAHQPGSPPWAQRPGPGPMAQPGGGPMAPNRHFMGPGVQPNFGNPRMAQPRQPAASPRMAPNDGRSFSMAPHFGR